MLYLFTIFSQKIIGLVDQWFLQKVTTSKRDSHEKVAVNNVSRGLCIDGIVHCDSVMIYINSQISFQ